MLPRWLATRMAPADRGLSVMNRRGGSRRQPTCVGAAVSRCREFVVSDSACDRVERSAASRQLHYVGLYEGQTMDTLAG
jgi:hypothetical protein